MCQIGVLNRIQDIRRVTYRFSVKSDFLGSLCPKSHFPTSEKAVFKENNPTNEDFHENIFMKRNL